VAKDVLSTSFNSIVALSEGFDRLPIPSRKHLCFPLDVTSTSERAYLVVGEQCRASIIRQYLR
jgi:hypothetical protein